MSALPAPAHDDTSTRDERVVCEHSQDCAGCPLIGRTYVEQLAVKRARVLHSLAPYTWLAAPFTEPVAPADPLFGYRTRAKLVVAPGAKLGLFARGGGHRVVDIPRCRVLAPALARVAAIVRTEIAAAETDGGPLAPYDPAGAGCLRAVDLREVLDRGAASVLVTFVVQRDRVTSVGALERAARALSEASPDVVGVACNFHEGDAPQILGGETLPLAGRTSAPDRIGSSVHFATFGSFVQAHRGQAARVHGLVAEACGLSGEGEARSEGKRPRVLDLYGGSGSIALGLASRGASVRLIESFAPAVAQARAAALAQGAAVEVQCDDVAGAVRAIARAGERFDAAVVNPPRRGMSPPAREWLARVEPPVIAYVSCDPDTLARDLDHFARLGYAANELRPLDMMPLTEEVETVAVLRRRAVPLPRAVYEDDQIVVIEKGPHEPTIPQGEYRGSLLARVRQMAGMDGAVAIHRLDIGTSGLVLFARRPELAAKWSRAVSAESTRTVYLAAVRGVTAAKGAITRELNDEGRAHAARTRYRRLAVTGGHSVLRVIPEQGRMHQIRRHLGAIGHPVLGDDRYGHAATNRFFEEKHGLDRTFLHGVRLEIEHPDTGAPLVLEAPLPGDLRSVLERVSGPGTLRSLDEKRALGAPRA
jgi:23S rRNA (uracil1939-C5)-methyltransferase